MPSIYTSFELEPGDTIDDRQKKLYLGMISCGEQAYTLGAAIAECRKTLVTLQESSKMLDETCAAIKKEFYAIKEARKVIGQP